MGWAEKLKTSKCWWLGAWVYCVLVMRAINRIGHFWVSKTLTFKWGQVHNLSCENEFYLHENKKSFSYQRLSTHSRFETEARGNSERLIANKHFYRTWGNEVSQAYNKSNVFCLFQIWNSWFWLFQTFIRDLVLSVPKIRIIDLRIISKMQTLKFLISAFPKHWNSGFWLSQYWNSGFWPSTLWNSLCWFFPNIRIQCFGFSKHWNSPFWLFHNMDFLILSFSKH